MNRPKVSIGYVSSCTVFFTLRSETRRQRKGNKIKIRLVWSDCCKSEIISDKMNIISQTGWWERLSLWHRTSFFSINVISLRYVLSSSSTSLRSGDAVCPTSATPPQATPEHLSLARVLDSSSSSVSTSSNPSCYRLTTLFSCHNFTPTSFTPTVMTTFSKAIHYNDHVWYFFGDNTYVHQ